MLQKLQKKFVFINMSLVSLVLIATFTAICLFNYTDMKKDWHAILISTAMMKEEPGPHQFPFDKKMLEDAPAEIPGQETESAVQGMSGENVPQTPQRRDNSTLMNAISFSVSVDGAGKVISKLGNNVEVSEELLFEIVDRALAASETKKEGTLQEYKLRYLVMDGQDHMEGTVAFLDVSRQMDDFKSLVLTLIIVGVIGELAFLVISIFLARFTIKPVKTAWEQQRQFVADASHELKTPLTVVLANTGILLSHKEDKIALQEKWIYYIKDEAERMKKLVEDMLFLAKSDTAKMPLEKYDVNFSDLVFNSLLAFESVAFEQKIRLKQEIAQDVFLCGNEAQLRQLITILLDNACKYTPADGQVSVTLLKKQDKVSFSVKNTGSFIPKEEQGKIFGRFYRVDESRVRKEGGYGLGLSIAKSIAEAHKGKLSVVSSEQEGTIFTAQL